MPRFICIAAAAFALLAAGCAKDEPSASPPTTRTTPTITLPPGCESISDCVETPGCDVEVVCNPKYIPTALDSCPASELSREGKQARARLKELLPRVSTGIPALEHEADQQAIEGALSVLQSECSF
jgi:hypothetical protein